MDHALEIFCDRFAQGAGTTEPWALEASLFGRGHLLLRSGLQCPLSAQGTRATGEPYAAGSLREDLARANGLTPVQAATVENASDDVPGHDPVLRVRLLAACGLTDHPDAG
jgi:hypothetical protein